MRGFAAVVTGLLLIATAAQAAAEQFPRPSALEPAVRFWTRVYASVSTHGGLIHDRDNLAVVYEVIRFDDDASPRARERHVDRRKAHYRRVLRSIARKNRSNLDAEEREVLALWPEGVSDRRLRRAAYGIRFQLGQSDKFRAGLKRSSAWEPHIRRTLRRMGLPEELAALPHVESSFNPDAYSRVGAAGVWQFTRSTGRRYMRIDHVVDERMDPFQSSVAAARLLEHNYSVTDNWALAITAYNHGLAGTRRAVRRVGSDDIARIVDEYDSRSWGFASRNFYAAFLAAVEVDFHSERYFGDIERHAALRTETVELPFYVGVDELVDAFGVERDRLRRLNRALRDPVWRGDKRVPRGYELRVPSGPGREPAAEYLARIDAGERYFAQIPDRYHRVRRGETLSTIAARYDVSARAIVSLNDLRSRHFIRAGRTLRLPVRAEAGAIAGRTYTVRRGDTLSGIARRVGVSTARLAAANGLENRHRIRPGQELRIDGRAAAGVDTGPKATTEVASADGATKVAMAETDTLSDAAAALPGPPAERRQADPGGASGDAGTGGGGGASGAGVELAVAERTVAPPEIAGYDLVAADSDGLDGADEAPAAQPGASALAADPADYSVAEDGTIEVQAAETLGHYAEWLDLRASQLRRINGMRYGKPVVIGHRLELRFSRVKPAEFERRRRAYHEALQARFFDQFRIAGTERRLIERGDSLWTLARRSDNVPVWLLRQYNPDLDFDNLHPGMPVTVPTVERQRTADGDGDAHAEADGDADASDA